MRSEAKDRPPACMFGLADGRFLPCVTCLNAAPLVCQLRPAAGSRPPAAAKGYTLPSHVHSAASTASSARTLAWSLACLVHSALLGAPPAFGAHGAAATAAATGRKKGGLGAVQGSPEEASGASIKAPQQQQEKAESGDGSDHGSGGGGRRPSLDAVRPSDQAHGRTQAAAAAKGAARPGTHR